MPFTSEYNIFNAIKHAFVAISGHLYKKPVVDFSKKLIRFFEKVFEQEIYTKGNVLFNLYLIETPILFVIRFRYSFCCRENDKH